VVVPIPRDAYPKIFPPACSVELAYTDAPVVVANTSEREKREFFTLNVVPVSERLFPAK
jgi:hypothetical protein